jgi:ADP-heptose:LPS heptosyltransferase
MTNIIMFHYYQTAKKNNISFVQFLRRAFSQAYFRLVVFCLGLIVFFHKNADSQKENPPEKIAIFTMDQLGDTLRAAPALGALRENFPQAQISVICGKYNQAVLENNPDIHEYFIIPKYPGFLKSLELIRKLKKESFSHAFIFSFGSLFAQFANYIFFLSGIPERLGGDYVEPKNLLTRRVKKSQKNNHVAALLEVVELIGAKSDDFSKKIFLTEEEKKWATEFLSGNNFSENNKLILVSPGGYGHVGYSVSRLWPEEKYIELLKRIGDEFPKSKIFLTGSEREIELCDRIRKTSGNNIMDLAGKISVRELAALLSYADIVITNDNGTLHIADAAGAKNILALLGPTDPAVMLESQNPAITISSGRQNCGPCITINGFFPCSQKDEKQKCLTNLTVDEVFRGILKSIQ